MLIVQQKKGKACIALQVTVVDKNHIVCNGIHLTTHNTKKHWGSNTFKSDRGTMWVYESACFAEKRKYFHVAISERDILQEINTSYRKALEEA